MKNLLIDSRIRKEEFDFLSKHFKVKKLELSNDVYEEISGHSDIFFCKINRKVICSPNAIFKDKSFIDGYLEVRNTYPNDVLYNVCQLENYMIINKYVDKKILELWNNYDGMNEDESYKNKEVIVVNQGYTKCSISITGSNSCITSDIGIYKKLKEKNIDVNLIKEDKIFLLDKNKNISKMNGFIGGATLTFDNKFIVFGDFNKLCVENQKIIKENLKKNNLELIDFKNLDIIDYGGALIF